MLLTDWLSGIHQLLRFRARARLRQRRECHLSRLASEVSVLEERSLLSSSVLGPETLMNQTVGGNQTFGSGRSFAMNASQGVIAAWSSTAGGGSNIIARRMGVDGNPLGNTFQVNTSTGGQRSNAIVGAYGNDKFVVVWQSTNNSQGTDVFARVFKGDGTALGNEFRINTTMFGDQEEPAVAWITSNQFVVAWDGPSSPIGNSTVFARIFNSNGTSVTNEIRVPTTNAGNKRDSEVISLTNGGFQVAWSGNGTGDQNGVFFRQFNASGQAQGSEIRANTSTTATERHPTMARIDKDQIVIAWQTVGDSLDTSGSGVVARKFNLDGTTQTDEFLINETTQGNQDDPSIAPMYDGSFVVAWHDARTPQTNSIYQREFNSDGTPRLGERIVNTTLDGAHAHPTIRKQVNGYVVGWDGKIWDGKYNANNQKTFDTQGVGLHRFGDPFMPENSRNSAGDVLYMNSNVPLKTITITNNSPQTIYPIMRAANSNQDLLHNKPDGSPWGLYDPIDPLNQEYRGYIGYQDPASGKFFVGLLPKQTVTVQVPLVFWDASRVYLATDGTDMFPLVDNLPAKIAPPNSPNPFHYHDLNQDYHTNPDLVHKNTTARFREPLNGGSGYVMWYHARSVAPAGKTVGLAEDVANDSATQLTEFTIRSSYLATLPTAADIPNSEKHDLVNYDVSYVDSMVLPVAMAALDVPIFGKNGGDKKPYGWIGAQMSVKEMQDAIKVFTTDNVANGVKNGLGDYFGGKGFPEFFIPDQVLAGIKVPAGQNVIDLSPILDKRSSFNQNLFMLTSSPGPIEAIITAHPNSTDRLRLEPADTTAHPEKLEVLRYALNNKVEMDLTSDVQGLIQQGTTLSNLVFENGAWYALLNKATGQESTSSGATITFKRKIVDYAENRLTELWYAWADYYSDHMAGVAQQTFGGKLTALSNDLTFDNEVDASKLVPGMLVTGLGLPTAANEKTVILKVILKQGDNTKAIGVQLSKLAQQNEPVGTSFTFKRPEAIPRSSEVPMNPLSLAFDPADQAKALAFSKAVYTVMQSFSTVPLEGAATRSQQLMANVIGCNIGKVQFIGNVDPLNKFGNAAIPNAIRDATKSVMRGVPDFQDPAYPESTWYPDPSLPSKNQTYNVWNMNPFVWFVHSKLKLSGYGFSVDDDVADVGADYATKLAIAVGGLGSLPQKDEWSWGAPYGTLPRANEPPITGTIEKITSTSPHKEYNDKYPNMYLISGLDPKVVAQINAVDPVSGTGARVTGGGILNPDTQLTTVLVKLSPTIVLLSRDATPGPGTFTFSAPKLPKKP